MATGRRPKKTRTRRLATTRGDWEIVPLRVGKFKPETIDGSEWDVWVKAHETTPRRRPRVKAAAAHAVLRRALVADFEAQHQPDCWPDGVYAPLPHDLTGYITKRSLDAAAASLTRRSMTLREAVAAAASVYDRTYTIRLMGNRVGGPAAEDCLAELLNGFPSDSSVAAWILAPALRRLLPYHVGPRWYFRFSEQIQRAKRLRPYFLPNGVALPAEGVAPNYGWSGLEAWLLKVYLFGSVGSRDDDRLRELVAYATGHTRRLGSSAATEGPLAFQFSQLCNPLKRYLHWYGSMPRGNRAERRFIRDLLAQLQDAVIPRLPPKDPRVISDDLKDHYRSWLRSVKRVWAQSRGDRTGRVRRSMLERHMDQLGFLANIDRYASRRKEAAALAKIRDRFWRDCGDLYAMTPAEFTRRFAMFVATLIELTDGDDSRFNVSKLAKAAVRFDASYRKLQVEPQRLKEIFAQQAREPFYEIQRAGDPEHGWEDPVFVP